MKAKNQICALADEIRDIPVPKFSLFQLVHHVWLCDDRMDKELFGKQITYFGIITGIQWNPKQSIEKGWIYTIKYPDGAISEIFEGDLNA